MCYGLVCCIYQALEVMYVLWTCVLYISGPGSDVCYGHVCYIYQALEVMYVLQTCMLYISCPGSDVYVMDLCAGDVCYELLYCIFQALEVMEEEEDDRASQTSSQSDQGRNSSKL